MDGSEWTDARDGETYRITLFDAEKMFACRRVWKYRGTKCTVGWRRTSTNCFYFRRVIDAHWLLHGLGMAHAAVKWRDKSCDVIFGVIDSMPLSNVVGSRCTVRSYGVVSIYGVVSNCFKIHGFGWNEGWLLQQGGHLARRKSARQAKINLLLMYAPYLININ